MAILKAEQNALAALDALHQATVHLENQWEISFERAAAKSNLDARAILFDCSNRILHEYGFGITKSDVERAQARGVTP